MQKEIHGLVKTIKTTNIFLCMVLMTCLSNKIPVLYNTYNIHVTFEEEAIYKPLEIYFLKILFVFIRMLLFRKVINAILMDQYVQ